MEEGRGETRPLYVVYDCVSGNYVVVVEQEGL